jgi:hypothetical protein
MFEILSDLEEEATKFKERRSRRRRGLIEDYQREIERFYDSFSQSGRVMVREEDHVK